jgi:hypothetical protein
MAAETLMLEAHSLQRYMYATMMSSIHLNSTRNQSFSSSNIYSLRSFLLVAG